MNNLIRIKTLKNLKANLKHNEFVDFAITLNGNAYSRKGIMLNPNNPKLFIVFNYIDSTEQTLTEKQILNTKSKITNIGKAIKLGAFFKL